MTTKMWIAGIADLVTDPNAWSSIGTPQAGDTPVLSGYDPTGRPYGALQIDGDHTIPSSDTLTATGGLIELGNGASLNLSATHEQYPDGTVTQGPDVYTNGAVILNSSVAYGALGISVNSGVLDYSGSSVEGNTAIAVAQGTTVTIGNAGVLHGGLTLQGGGVLDLSGAIGSDLAGVVDLSPSSIVGPGTINVPSSLTIASNVAPTITVLLDYIGETVTLSDPLLFAGTLVNEGNGGAVGEGSAPVVLTGLQAAGYSFADNKLMLYGSGGTVVDTLDLQSTQMPAVTQTSAGVDVWVGGQTGVDAGASVPVYNPPSGAVSIQDDTTGANTTVVGSAYSGPVAGLQTDLADITTDTVVISALTSNQWILAGESVSSAPNAELRINAAGGTNVLDGQDPSDFLVGGSGMNTFYLDDRNPTGPVWSTLANFHSGDNATIWGMTAQDFDIYWSANQGATGYTGATLHAFSKTGGPEASVTLSGYSTAALSNGQLSITFGTIQGNNFMLLHAN